MSTSQRAYNLLRTFINTEWERLHAIELEGSAPSGKTPQEEMLEPVVRHEPTNRTPFISNEEQAARILGVSLADDFATVKKAFQRLHSRSDPANFPIGSAEARQAAAIHQQVEIAYQILIKGMDATSVRFGSLEFE